MELRAGIRNKWIKGGDEGTKMLGEERLRTVEKEKTGRERSKLRKT